MWDRFPKAFLTGKGWCLIGIALLWDTGSVYCSPIPVQVTGDRINLRARPGLNYEVAGQAEFDQTLMAKSFSEEGWVEIVPPADTDAWVHSGYIADNRVSVKRLNIRCGPGINYSKIGHFSRNDQVLSGEIFGEWLKISAPPAASLWVSVDYIRKIEEEEEEAAPPAVEDRQMTDSPETQIVVQSPPPEVAPDPPPPEPPAEQGIVVPLVDSRHEQMPKHLVPPSGQGEHAEFSGILRRTPYLLNRPATFRLADSGGRNATTRCYVHGDTQQLKNLLGQELRIVGKEYWIQDVDHPVVMPGKIVLPQTD